MASGDEQNVDWAAVERLASDLGADDFRDVVNAALRSMQAEVRALLTAVRRDDRDRTSQLAHVLRSNFELFGMRGAADLAADVEAKATAGHDRAELRTLVNHLAEVWDGLKPALRGAVKRLPRPE